MSPAPRLRSAGLVGLALAVVVAAWWMGSVRLAIEQGADPARHGAGALTALWVLRGIVLAITLPRAGACRGARAAVAEGTVLLAPAWPLAALAWTASAASPWPLLAAEGALALAAVGLAQAGRTLRRRLPSQAMAEWAVGVLGIAVAAGVWLARDLVAQVPA